MLGTTFYHETLRKVVVGFGTLFNEIYIQRKNSSGTVISKGRVPFAYGPKEKFIVRINQDSSISDDGTEVQMTLPRIGFEFTGLAYDAARKLNTLNKFQKVGTDASRTKWQYERVPYNLDFNLYCMVKNTDDGLQIIEQILPYFTPEFNITLKDMYDDLGITTDVPIILNSVTNEDEYEGNFDTRRVLTWTLTFTAKAFLYSPTNETGLIKKVTVQSYPQTADTTPESRTTTTPSKELIRHVVVPNPTTADADDDYGYTTTRTDYFLGQTGADNYDPLDPS